MKDNERGSVAVIFLALLMVISLFLFAVYKLAVVDYQVVVKSYEEIDDRVKQNNVIEVLKPYLTEDIMGEPNLEDIWDMIYEGHELGDRNDVILAKDKGLDELLEYDFEYREKDSSSWKRDEKDKWDFVDFKNYEEKEHEYDPGNVDDFVGIERFYDVVDNWDNEDDVLQYRGEGVGYLHLPSKVYMKVKFDSDVYRIDVEVGNDFQVSTFEFTNRGYGKEGDSLYGLYELKGNLPPSVEYIRVMTEDSRLGNTEISILKGREIDVEVKNKESAGVSDKSVLRKTLYLDMKKGKYEFVKGREGK